jgi:hypothetical protein
MKKISGVLFLSIIVLVACHNKASSDAADKASYEKTKETLEEKEKKNPLLFLNISSNNKHNILGQTVIKASIINNAKICTYKDVQLELAFYSGTGTLLEKDNETIYKEITPGNSIDFKTKYYAPKGTDSVAVKIVDAKNY